MNKSTFLTLKMKLTSSSLDERQRESTVLSSWSLWMFCNKNQQIKLQSYESVLNILGPLKRYANIFILKSLLCRK